VHFVDARTGWVVGNGGAILATRNGGDHWELQNSGTDKDLFGVDFVDARMGWARSQKDCLPSSCRHN